MKRKCAQKRKKTPESSFQPELGSSGDERERMKKKARRVTRYVSLSLKRKMKRLCDLIQESQNLYKRETINFNGRNKKERESLERAGVFLEVFQTARVAKKRKIVYYSDDALLQNCILFSTHILFGDQVSRRRRH